MVRHASGRGPHRFTPRPRRGTSKQAFAGRLRRLHCESLESRLVLNGDALICVDYAFFDQTAPNTQVTSLEVGHDYLMRAFIMDNRPGETLGIEQIFFDVTYDANLISIDGDLTFGPQYNLAPTGNTSQAGFIDAVGALSRGLPDPANGEYLLYELPFSADAAGTLEISAVPDNVKDILFYFEFAAVQASQIAYEGNTIEIVDSSTPTVSISPTQNGNEAGAVPGIFTITQSMPTGSATVIQYTVGGSATEGSDYQTIARSATIAAGQTSTTITVPVINDNVVEASETVTITLSSTNNPQVSIDQNAKQATLNIADNDTAQVRIAAAANGNESGTVSGRFTVTQSAPSSTDTSVTFSLSGTATSGSDYTSIPTSVMIPAGQTTATITVPVIDDALVEGSETVIATLTGVNGDPQISLQTGSTQATISILDNDTALVRVETLTNPGEGGPTNGVFRFLQTAPSAGNTTIVYSISGSAGEGVDYTALSRTATIAAGQTSTTLTVPVLNDAIVEADETVVVRIESINVGGRPISIDTAQRQATMTIADNDSALVSIAATANGSENGPTPGRFTITQSAVSSTATVVSLSIGGTATAGSDYTVLPSAVTIAAGQTSATIDVIVIDDELPENAETVIVSLAGITSGDPQIQVDSGQDEASIEITDNENPLVSITTLNNANEAGPVPGRFTVSQTRILPTDTIVNLSVSGTAGASDFAALPMIATIPAGQTSTTIDVAVLDDELIEGAETVIVTLDGFAGGEANLEIDPAHAEATLQILDDETGLVSIAVTQDGAEDGEVNGVFTITQDGVAEVDTVITLVVSGSATEGVDYASLSRTVTIVAGETSATVTVSVTDDDLVEPDETVTITLDTIDQGSSLVMIDAAHDTASAAIVDDDTAAVGFESATDGDENGPTGGSFTIVQSAPSSTDTVIHYTIAGTATNGSDYTELTGSATIPAGETSVVINVAVLDDTIVEATESVMLTLSALDTGGAQVTIDAAHATAAIEIADNDTAQVSVVQKSDGSEAGPTAAVFTIVLSAPSSTDTEVQYTIGGTATPGSDFTPPSGTVTIPAGSTSQDVTVAVLDDVELEGPESVTIALDSVTGDPEITIDTASDTAEATIADNETGLIGIAVTVSGVENGPTPGQFTITQSGTTDVDTVIALSVGGTATAGDDYVALPQTVTIAAGQTSVTIAVTVIDDSLIEGAETVIVTLDSITSGDNRVGLDSAANSATMTINDDDTGLVSIAPGSGASEAGPTPGTFIVTQSGISDVDTVVSYTFSGGATRGSDYTSPQNSVTIAAGQTSAVITILAIDDALVEADESVIVTLTGIASGSSLVQVDSENDTAEIEITDNDSAEVSLSAATNGNEAGAIAGSFTVTLSAASSTDTVVGFTLGGTASASDYGSVPASVTIPAGQTTATIAIPVVNDTVVEGNETVELTLTGVTSGDADITIGDQDSASITIADNDSATIGFANATSSTFEISGTHTIVVRLSIGAGGTLGQSVTVNVAATGGTATAADFMLDTTSVTFAAGSADGAERMVTLSLVDDGVFEDDETVVLSLSIDDGSGFPVSVGGTTSHTVTIVDDPSEGVISGIVWTDTDGDGTVDDNEYRIPGVTVHLTGMDNFGETVDRTTTTDANGAYSFTGLASGTYDITEVQPAAFQDGQESLGTVAGAASGQAADDRFASVVLAPTQTGVNYNFGERGLKSQYVNVRLFLAKTVVHDFIINDIVHAAATSRQIQSAAAAFSLAAPAAKSNTSAALQAESTAAPAATASPQTNAASPSAILASSQSQPAAVESATSSPASAPAAPAAAAADVSIASFLASSLAASQAEPGDSALAFAAAMTAQGDAADEPAALPQTAAPADDEAAPADSTADEAAMLLEDSSPQADEQLTDQALDEEDSWLEEQSA